MRVVLQRVSRAKVSVNGRVTGEIGRGLLILLGVGKSDDASITEKMVDKVIGLRIFDDADGKMNLSLKDIAGDMLVVSQFTLYADTRRGRRPSFIDAAAPEDGRRWYDYFVKRSLETVAKVATGEFGAMMDVELVNDGPVTIILDSERFR